MLNSEKKSFLEAQIKERPKKPFMSRAFLLIPDNQNYFVFEIVCVKSHLYQKNSEDGYLYINPTYV